MNTNRQYWAFRVHNHKDLYTEIIKGRLRQGWGYDKSHDLRKLSVDSSNLEDRRVLKNLPILNNVSKGDILLVPVPNVVMWHKIAMVEATEDWYKEGVYNFEILDGEVKDCGHTFPVKCIKEFDREDDIFNQYIRRTFRCRLRFWSLAQYGDYIEEMLSSK